MAKRASPLVELDIAAEALTQQDGLAERVARNRAGRVGSAPSSIMAAETSGKEAAPPREANGWRKGKSLLQVAIAEESHVELSIIAKRRRMTLSQLVKDAVHDWLEAHGHPLRLEMGFLPHGLSHQEAMRS